MKILPNSASFLITENCNNSCKYCFEKHNTAKMTPEIIKKSLEFLVENAIKDNKDHFSVMIFGGEPLLEPDLVELIFEYGCMLSKKYDKRFDTSIVTNATIFTDRIKDIITKYKSKANLSVQLSVDGIQEVQDMYRVRKDGTGSFVYVEKTIPKWKEIFKDNHNRLSIHGCINKKSMPYLYENYLFFREVWGIERIWFMPIHSEIWEESDVKIYEEELTKIKNYILEKAKQNNNIQELKNFAPLDRCLRGDQRASHPCSAGKSFVTITSTGDIYPCHHFYFNDPDETLLIGNIYEGVDDDKRRIFLKYENDDMSCHKTNPDCDAYQCYRCIADNWVTNGSMLSQIQGPRCDMSKIERKIQVEIKEEITKMGLLNSACTGQQNHDSGDGCRCNLGAPRCDNHDNGDACRCNLGSPPVLNQEDGDKIAIILKLILDKIQNLEDGQKRIEEEMNKIKA